MLSEQKDSKQFRADFIYNNQIISMTFASDGNLMTGIYEIGYEQLPKEVASQLKDGYPNYKTLIVWEHYRNGKLEYEIELAKGAFHFIVTFNSKLRLINRFEVDRKLPDDAYIN